MWASGALALAALGSVFAQPGCTAVTRRDAAAPVPAAGSCKPGETCWPTEDDWRQLQGSLTGRLEESPSPLAPCMADADGGACATVLARMKNPFFLQDQPGATESLGWLGAWTATPSAMAVEAKTAGDVVAAVKFARQHRLRVVIKGTGHDYLGRSSAPDSLLVWTHAMRGIAVDDAFVPDGCEPGTAPVPAVTLGAGVRWGEAYQAVTVEHHRYVQGGGCTSVGAAGGFLQGGGFGSWSKKYGIAAAGMLEAEVVTASGERLVANACHNADLFWALRGGGGGTFGVVTRVTLMTHPLPSQFGFASGRIKATTDAAYQDLLQRFVVFAKTLDNEFWGEQVHVTGDNVLEVSMAFQGMSKAEAEKVWSPLRAWIDQHPDTLSGDLRFGTIPAEKMWDRTYLEGLGDAITKDDRPDQARPLFWWTGDGDQVATYWLAYESTWIPRDLFEGRRAPELAHALFEASRAWDVELHFNKGQAGASPEARFRDAQTAMNPAVLDAAALAIVAANTSAAPGVPGREPDASKGRIAKARVDEAMRALRAVAPRAGSYVNETDYFEPDWQRAFWGNNYARLLAIKHSVDPDGFFTCHHCVGSEGAPAASGISRAP